MMKRHRSPVHLGLTLPEIREATIALDILTYLKWRQIPAWPTHSTKNHPETPGMADILGILKGGRFMAIEVKSEGGVVSKVQREWLNRVRGCGALAMVARSVEDVQKAIDAA
jgi:hypothetical protein